MGISNNTMLVVNGCIYYYLQMIRGDSKDYNLLDNWVRGLKITSNVLSF